MNKKLKIHRLLDRWAPSAFFLFPFVKILEKLKQFGYRPKEDGWRTAAQSYLRTEHSKFTLAAFRLNPWSDVPLEDDKGLARARTHIIERLALFLRGHPVVHRQLLWGRFSVKREVKEPVDIVAADFNDDGAIAAIQPCFDPRWNPFESVPDDQRTRLNAAIVNEYNRLKDVLDESRPRRLKAHLIKWLRDRPSMSKKELGESIIYLERILNSAFIHFEVLPPLGPENSAARFKYPNFILRKHPGFGLFNMCCRLTADHAEADIWFQVSHVPVDGAPIQEILNALKAQWTTRGALVFPALHNGAKQKREMDTELCSTSTGEAGQYHGSRFIGFRPLLKVRGELNKLYAGKLLAPITVISMLGWGLAHHDIFRGRKFLFPVDLPRSGGKERTLGFVVIRPSLYFNNPAFRDNFLAYQLEFNRRLYKAQSRIGEIYKLFEIFAISPPAIYWLIKKYMQPMLSEIFGSVVITMIRDADCFIAPSADIILDGFIAFGNYSIPTEDNETAGLVSVKSAKDKAGRYISAVEEVVADFGKYL